MSAPGRVEDLYRELAKHRVGEAINELRNTPPECLAAHTARALEQAAGALACATATYASPDGPVAQRLQDLINGMLAAAASFEHLADAAADNTRRRN
jgi:hypothetical protein